jgi:ATP-dependent exoDNAse (exonuclease V) beta subunit
MPPLTIFKASAGSGKTYMLTLHYLELLFRDPRSYRNILAVTFTNKAASEMKSRILERLHSLSCLSGDESSEDLEHLVRSTGKTSEAIIAEARSLLVSILNDYSRFSVGTIDRFFQSVIRSFAREIGLPLGFSLELDRDRILSEAVDRMFLRIADDAELREWLMRFAESRLENEQNWNFRNDIVSLGKELFTERFQQMQLEAGDGVTREVLKGFIETLDRIEKETRQRIIRLSEATLDEQQKRGWPLDRLPGKSRSPAAFFTQAAAGERIVLTPGQKTAITDREKWLATSGNDPGMELLVDDVLMPALKGCDELSVVIRSVQSIRPYIYTFGILRDILESIREITGERNLFLLSDAAYFLRGLVSNNPTPFIYEKTGNTYYHIMLDEFQDTSAFQWENFKPLLNHTLSLGKENMVVGDVKQSIYRWRNSDWKILAEGILQAFDDRQIHTTSLSENWRSAEQIVHFNNDLFRYTAEIIRTMINREIGDAAADSGFADRWNTLVDTAYAGVVQDLPSSKSGSGGYVKCTVLDDREEAFDEQALKLLPEWITELQLKGFRPGDIAVLVRSNHEGERVAHRLMEHAKSDDCHPDCRFNFVSNESLFVHRHPVIRFLVHLLTYINTPGDALNHIHLKYFFTEVTDMTTEEFHRAMEPGVAVSELLPERITAELDSIRRLPLYEMVEQLIIEFGLHRTSDALPYLQAFQEIILEQQRKDPVNLNDFLLYWNEYGVKKALTVSEGQDAIRILTIHKAKGLQFKAVLLPFCRWSLTTEGRHETILWCRTENTLFSDLPVVPVKYRKDLLETCFADEYLEERIMGYVDNLNLLYVALTRAQEALFLGIRDLQEDRDPGDAGQLIRRFLDQERWEGAFDRVSGTFTIGGIPTPPSGSEALPPEWRLGDYPVEVSGERLKLRLRSTDYFARKAEDLEEQMDFGNMMHELLRQVVYREDIDRVVETYQTNGLIDEKTKKEMGTFLNQKLAGEQVKEWFSDRFSVINERDIIRHDGALYRPDRVMIEGRRAVVVDYKFGEEKESRHERQVRQYMDLLAELGFDPVEGYLWYVMLDEIKTMEKA